MVSDTTLAYVKPVDGPPADAVAASAAQRLADAQTRLQAWQALGLQRTEPLRLARLQALARRLAQLLQAPGLASAGAAAAAGPAQPAPGAAALSCGLLAEQARLMGERLGAGVAELSQRLHEASLAAPAAAASAPTTAATAVDPATVEGVIGGPARKAGLPSARKNAEPAERREPGPLGRLVQALDAAAAMDAADGTSAPAAASAQATGPALAGPGELKVAREARSTWARLGAQRQLARSLAQAPANAGPLNSHQLLLRALQQMQQLSPGYLLHFMGHAQTLLELEHLQQADGAGPVPAAAAARAASAARASASPARASRPSRVRKHKSG